MTVARAFIGYLVAITSIAALSACSQPQEAASNDAAAEAPAAAPPAAPAATPAAPPAAPAATLVTLDIVDAAGAPVSGDPAAGAVVFRQCQTCHTAIEGQNRVGPSLYGIIGRPAGTIPGFRYSNANKNSGITWTEQEMYTYLEDPKKRIPGTIMAFVGLKQPKQRADVIAYLKQNTPS